MNGRPDRPPLADRQRPPPAAVSRPPPGNHSQSRLPPRTPQSLPDPADYSPLSWRDCFDDLIFVEANLARFGFYTASLPDSPPESPVLLFLHGAGCTALSFACIAKHLRSFIPVIALDFRAHGVTTEIGAVVSLETETLCSDVTAAVKALFAARGHSVPNIVICGHSMGGAIAARVAHSEALPVLATMLIDVVEGTAISALPHMSAWLSARPTSFSSVEAAVRYVVAKGHVRNLHSARRSVPSQLTETESRWVWRTNLSTTHKCWNGWFQGLSAIFLAAPGPKLLILAGVDRLDRALTIAQMQGKFQNILIPDAGHSIAEDQPEKTASVILDFLRRNLLIENGSADDLISIFQQREPIPSPHS